jgi:hypothetical protein
MARRRRDIDDSEVADGETIHVGLELMDSWQRSVHDHFHRPNTVPGYVNTPQNIADQRASARRLWIDRAGSAWKHPGTQQITDAPAPRPRYEPPQYIAPSASDIRDAMAKRDAARRQWIEDKQRAWQKPFTAFRDGPQPDVSILFRGDPDDPDDDPDNGNGADAVERRRAREHADRKVRLSEAWRTPTGTGNPNRATAIEHQAERWRHGR